MRAGQRVVRQELVGELRDRENEHKVEEQLQRTDAVVYLVAVVAEVGRTGHVRIRRISHPKRNTSVAVWRPQRKK